MGKTIKAYKGFDKNMKCRGFQFKKDKEYEETGNIKACVKGFHACEYPLDVFSYYAPSDSRYCEVDQSGTIDSSESDKTCSSKIKIGAELDIRGLVKATISYVKERCTNEFNADKGKPATAGDSGAATAGSYGAATAGDSGAATAGSYGAATAGYRGAATAGYRGAATSKGKSATGKNGLSVARGNNVRVKGGIGSILVIAEEKKDSHDIKEWNAVLVDGKKIKADTWYKLEDGDLIECNDE